MNATKISCILALTAIVLLIIAGAFSSNSSGWDSLDNLIWFLPLLLVIAIIAIVGLIFSIIGIIKERSILSWICIFVYLLPLIFIIFINLPIVNDHYYKKRKVENSWEEKAKKEQNDYWKIEPSSIVLAQANTDIIYLTNIRREERKDLIGLPPAEKDDFFICFDQKALNKRNIGSKISYTMHVIHDNGGYKTELRRESKYLYVDGASEQQEVSNEWSKNDEICNKVLDYYFAHQTEMKK